MLTQAIRFKIMRNIGHSFFKMHQFPDAIDSYENLLMHGAHPLDGRRDLASVSALPGACGDAPGVGDCCDNCPDAIDGGVCYPGMIGKLNPVTQLSNGTIVEVITTICPDVDPGALCADAAPKAQFIAPAALAAALLLSL